MGDGLHGGFGSTKGFITAIKKISIEDYLQKKLNYIYYGEKNLFQSIRYLIQNRKV